MAKASISWRFDGGYSRLLDQTQVKLKLVGGPAQTDLKLSPFKLFSQPTEFSFRVSHGLRGSAPGNLKWKVRPGAKLRAVILMPRNAFLGNFRVPEDHFAIQWDIEGEVAGGVSKRFPSLLVSAETGSTLVHSWVTQFSSEASLANAIEQSWRAFVDPFNPEEVQHLREGQVIRFRWRGSLGAVTGVQWGLGRGWGIGPSQALLSLQAACDTKAFFGAHLRLTQKGNFILRLSRKRGRIQLSISEERKSSRKARLEVRATLQESVKLKPDVTLAEPLLKPLNDQLAKAVARRVEIELALESERWKRRRVLLKAVWRDLDSNRFVDEYRKIVSGTLPEGHETLDLSGRFEVIRGKRFTVALNLLNWLHLGKSSEKKDYFRVEMGPQGELTVEEGDFVAKTHYRWDELQLVSLLASDRRKGARSRKKFLWTFQIQKRFKRRELTGILRKALQLKSIESFDLPGSQRFPLELDLCWYSEFSNRGISIIRESPAQEKWKALTASLECADPELYGEGSFGRDWIVSSEVRRNIDKNPVQSHLRSVYPLAGRSGQERKQVVATYLRVKRFLELMELWKRGETGRLMESLDLGWEVPIFYCFHLLCPATQRRSAVVLTGELTRVWGEPDIIGE